MLGIKVGITRKTNGQLRLLGVLKNNMFHTDDPRFQSIDTIGNSLFTFNYAALTGEGPEDNPVLAQAVLNPARRVPSRDARRNSPHRLTRSM